MLSILYNMTTFLYSTSHNVWNRAGGPLSVHSHSKWLLFLLACSAGGPVIHFCISNIK